MLRSDIPVRFVKYIYARVVCLYLFMILYISTFVVIFIAYDHLGPSILACLVSQTSGVSVILLIRLFFLCTFVKIGRRKGVSVYLVD